MRGLPHALRESAGRKSRPGLRRGSISLPTLNAALSTKFERAPLAGVRSFVFWLYEPICQAIDIIDPFRPSPTLGNGKMVGGYGLKLHLNKLVLFELKMLV